MSAVNRLGRRFLSAARTRAPAKGPRSDMNFKEGNDVASPYDVLDRNIPSMEHRFRLYEMRRLKEQLALDLPELEDFGAENAAEKDALVPDQHLTFSHKIISAFPGVSSPTDVSNDSTVTLAVQIDALGLTLHERDRLVGMLNLDRGARTFDFTVGDYPFVSQNKRRACELLQSLLELCRDNSSSTRNIPADSHATTIAFFDAQAHRRTSPPARPEFPAEWLRPEQRQLE